MYILCMWCLFLCCCHSTGECDEVLTVLHTEMASPQEDYSYAVTVSLTLPARHAHISVFDSVLPEVHHCHWLVYF